jgi:hypothetical protein
MKMTFLIVAMVLSVVSTGLANIADPSIAGRSKSLDTSLSIRIDKKATEAKLIIPRSQLRQLRAELEQIDGGGDEIAAPTQTVTRTQTIVSGALLSLAFVFGGMWFIRSGSQNSKPVIGAAVLLTVGSIATFVYGNAGPPPEARSISGKMFSQGVHMYKQAWGPIKLEVSDKVKNPELIVPDSPAEPAAE